MKKRLLNNITLTFVSFFIILVITGVLIGKMTAKTSSLAKERAVTGIHTTLESRAHTVEEYFAHQEDLLKQYSMLPDIKKLLKDGDDESRRFVQSYTRNLFGSLENWEGLYVSDPTTKVLAHSDYSFVGMLTRDEDSARELVNSMYKIHGLYNAGVIKSPTTGKYLVSMYCPVFEDGEIIGYVGGGPYEEDLFKILENISFKDFDTSNYYIINLKEEAYIYSANKSDIGGNVSSPVILDAISTIHENKTTITTYYTYGESEDAQIVAYYYMPSYDWAVIAIDKVTNVYKFSNLTVKIIILSFILAFAVFLFIFLVLSTHWRKEKKLRVNADTQNKNKSAFFANMSHELRTPMNAVVGMADILLNSNLSDEQEKYVIGIKNAGTSIVSMVNDILDYSKMDFGYMTIIPVEYSTGKLFQSVKMIIESRIKSPNVSLVVDIDSDMPQALLGDDIRIKQILINLMNNAVKFTETGFVKLLVRIVNRDDDDIYIDYIIRDSGMGMKPEDLDKLFNAFSQVDTKRNREKEGTGLGLAICQKLTELMGGRLTVESEYGKGSTFILSLKQKIVDPMPMESLDTISSDNDETVNYFKAPELELLIVDDNDTNLLVAEGLLNPIGAIIDTASSGKEAVTKAMSKKYDIIFMDHLMPDMDGIETIQTIRELPVFDNYYEKANFVALTANAMKEARDSFNEAGIENFLTKPIDLIKYVEMIRKLAPKEKIKD